MAIGNRSVKYQAGSLSANNVRVSETLSVKRLNVAEAVDAKNVSMSETLTAQNANISESIDAKNVSLSETLTAQNANISETVNAKNIVVSDTLDVLDINVSQDATFAKNITAPSVTADIYSMGSIITVPSPTAGQTIAIDDDIAGVIVEPDDTIGLTFAFPPNPKSGQILFISTTNQINLTVENAIIPASMQPTAIGAGDSLKFVYNTANTTWYTY